jgi:hypothetical protein
LIKIEEMTKTHRVADFLSLQYLVAADKPQALKRPGMPSKCARLLPALWYLEKMKTSWERLFKDECGMRERRRARD